MKKTYAIKSSDIKSLKESDSRFKIGDDVYFFEYKNDLGSDCDFEKIMIHKIKIKSIEKVYKSNCAYLTINNHYFEEAAKTKDEAVFELKKIL